MSDFIPARLVPKSYKPLKLEQGMFFSTIKKEIGTERAYIHLHTLNFVPKDVELYTQLNGMPVELYIVYEGNSNLNEFEILATPEQIGWFDDGDYSDEISDITVRQINIIFSDYEGFINLEYDIEADKPVLYDNKVTMRFINDSGPVDFDEENDDDDRLIYY
jgi:hypothetical protein